MTETQKQHEEQGKRRPNTMQPQLSMIDLKLGDAQMTYIQCVIQESNSVLFKQILVH